MNCCAALTLPVREGKKYETISTLQPAYEIARTAALIKAMSQSNLSTVSKRDRI
jgi:hypothetical protein